MWFLTLIHHNPAHPWNYSSCHLSRAYDPHKMLMLNSSCSSSRLSELKKTDLSHKLADILKKIWHLFHHSVPCYLCMIFLHQPNFQHTSPIWTCNLSVNEPTLCLVEDGLVLCMIKRTTHTHTHVLTQNTRMHAHTHARIGLYRFSLPTMPATQGSWR